VWGLKMYELGRDYFLCNLKQENTPHSIHQYSNMAMRLASQNCKISFAAEFPNEKKMASNVLKASEPC